MIDLIKGFLGVMGGGGVRGIVNMDYYLYVLLVCYGVDFIDSFFVFVKFIIFVNIDNKIKC